jgi:hypothetical protein
MRKNLLIAAVIFAMSTFAIYARESDRVIHTNVPFSFQVDQKVLPAGKYEAEKLSNYADEWIIRSADGKHEAEFVTDEADLTLNPPKNTALRFEDVNGQHYLAGIEVQGDTEGWDLPLTSVDLTKVDHHTRRVMGTWGKRSSK